MACSSRDHDPFAELDAELVERHGSIFRGEYGWAPCSSTGGRILMPW
jgi:hypothetical protein